MYSLAYWVEGAMVAGARAAGAWMEAVGVLGAAGVAVGVTGEPGARVVRTGTWLCRGSWGEKGSDTS